MPENTSINTMFLSSAVFLSELQYISKDIIWKNTYLANKYEDPDYAIEAEMFVAASKGLLTFDNIYQFDRETLFTLGLSETAIDAALDDKYTISEDLRDMCTNIYIKRLLEKDPITGLYKNYVEYNNYYRMLMGLPGIGDTDFVYNTKYSDIDNDTPIHLLPLGDRYNLEQRGYVDEVMKLYPDKKYIKHIASKSIDPYIARISERFSILHMNNSEYSNLVEDFKDIYNNCRYSIVQVYYNDVFRKDNETYDGFLAMCILFMTIQMMHYKYLDVDITRDFYDLESIRYIYDSYSVPFFSTIPLQYHKNIVKNINRLISYKGSTRVFFDLFELFNFGGMDIYEYYILRSHKFDHQGNPVFVYKEDGSLDKQAMFDIKFGKVRLYDDPPLELSNTKNHLTYETMTLMDPYWVSDPELLNKLYEEDYNYLETKYIGIQTLFDMMRIVYEASYFIQMIVDNREALDATTTFYNNINANVNIFDMIIYLSALICEKYGYEGNISSELPTVAKILGFNFKELATIIQNDINKNHILSKDDELVKLLIDMNVDNIRSVNTTFKKITQLRRHITEKITSSTSREVYFAYYNLEKVLMYSSIIEDVYIKKNGEIAKSFKDLLNDLNPELYVRFLTPELDINAEIDDVLILFKRVCTELKYFESVDGMDIGNIIQHLFTVLEFFKSAKAELTGYNITYIISSRGMNTIKYFAEIDHIIESGELGPDRFIYLTDMLGTLEETIDIRDRIISLEDKFQDDGSLTIIHDEIAKLDTMIKSVGEIIKLEYDNTVLFDAIAFIELNDLIKSNLLLTDKEKIILLSEEIYYEFNISRISDRFDSLRDMIINGLEIYDSNLISNINKLEDFLIKSLDIIKKSDNLTYDDIIKSLQELNILVHGPLLFYDKLLDHNKKEYSSFYSEMTLDDLLVDIIDILSKDVSNKTSLINMLTSLRSEKTKVNLLDNMILYERIIKGFIWGWIIRTPKIILDDTIKYSKIFLSFRDESSYLFDEISLMTQNNQNNEVMLFNDKLLLLSEQLIK